MIDRVIHQIWFPVTAAELPREWRRFARSWQRWHPDHRYLLWGPAEARDFIAAQHPDFLATYDGYPLPIQRVNALRILLLHHFGGLCADLDLECTRNVRPLLEHQRLVLAAEPDRHSTISRHQGARRVVLTTAFMASERGHPFWNEVKWELQQSAARRDPAGATGSPVLGRCYERSIERLGMTVLPPEHFSPVDESECRDHSVDDLERWIERTRHSYGVHHWAGSWSRKGDPWAPATRHHPHGLATKVRHPEIHRAGPGQLLAHGPLVSCVMVSRGWKDPARWAVDCFRRQSYQDRELVVVTTNGEGDLRQHLESLNDPRVRFAGTFPPGTRLGALRNVALDHARGELVATWDEDHLSGADRLATGVTTLLASNAAASFLERVTLWWPACQELAISARLPWEGTIVAHRRALPRYREVDQGEDFAANAQLRGTHPWMVVDDPSLCIWAILGNRVWGSAPFTRFFEECSFRASGLDYERGLSVVNKYVPVVEVLDWLTERDPRTFLPSPSAAAQLDAPHPGRAAGDASPDPRSRLVLPRVDPLRSTDPPLRFLFAWELGGGLGHTVPLAQIARPLLDAGHEVHLALLDLSTARAGLGQLVRHPGLHLWQAPYWPASLRGSKDSASYAELLFHAGYLDPVRLSGLVDGWESLFRSIRPEMLLADHAPTALLTARGHGFRRATVGTGFFDPLPGSPMPTFREWEPIPRRRLEDAEHLVLATCNTILAARSYPTLDTLNDLLAVDEHFLLTVPELDHFELRARDPTQRYHGSLPATSHGRPVAWPSGPEPAVFAYLKGDYPAVSKILEALKTSPWRIVTFLPGCSPSAIASISTDRLTIVTDPVDMIEACRGCDAIVCHSGSGTTMTALQAGRPVVMLPMYLEQYLVGRRIQSLGAGLVVQEDRIDDFSAALRRVLEQPSFREAAEAFSRRYASPGGNRVAETVSARCQELALETRAQREPG